MTLICFPALSLQVRSLSRPPAGLQLEGQDFPQERAHSRVCSSLAVWEKGKHGRILERMAKEACFPRWGRGNLQACLFSSSSSLSSSFSFFPLPSASVLLSCHILKHWTLASEATALLPLTQSLPVMCDRGGIKLSPKPSEAFCRAGAVADIIISEHQFDTDDVSQLRQSLTSCHTLLLCVNILLYYEEKPL